MKHFHNAAYARQFASVYYAMVKERISYFTGRYPHSHKNRVNYTPCDPREVLIQRRLQHAGYQTGSVGKLHFYPPTVEHARSTGFDQVQLDDGHARLDKYSDYARWRQAHDPQADVPYDATVKHRKDGGNPHRAVIDSTRRRPGASHFLRHVGLVNHFGGPAPRLRGADQCEREAERSR